MNRETTFAWAVIESLGLAAIWDLVFIPVALVIGDSWQSTTAGFWIWRGVGAVVGLVIMLRMRGLAKVVLAELLAFLVANSAFWCILKNTNDSLFRAQLTPNWQLSAGLMALGALIGLVIKGFQRAQTQEEY